MKKCWSFLKNQINVDRFVQATIVIAVIAIIFVGIMIFTPQISDKLFPRLRESVSAIAMMATVFATLILAYATLRIIRSDREREERERRERLLNELLEWAVDIEKSATNRRKPERDELWDARQKYLSSKAMSDYMKRVASCFTGLSDNLVDVITRLDETTSATDEALSVSSPSRKPNTENLIPKEKRLREQIVVLTQQIANIKTKDIT